MSSSLYVDMAQQNTYYRSFIALTLDQILNIVITLWNGRFTGGGHFQICSMGVKRRERQTRGEIYRRNSFQFLARILFLYQSFIVCFVSYFWTCFYWIISYVIILNLNFECSVNFDSTMFGKYLIKIILFFTKLFNFMKSKLSILASIIL